MRILDRYLVRGFLAALLYCLLLFMMLFIVIDVFNNLEDFLKHSINMRIILTYYLYSSPFILVQIVPVAALVAVLFVLGNLNRHHEIVAMKACGVSGFHILAPYLFMGVLLSFAILLVNENLVPKASLTSRAIMEGLIEKGRKKLEERSLANVTVYGHDGRMVYAREYEILKKTLYDVVLLEDNPHRPLQMKMSAKSAWFDGSQWNFGEVIRYKADRRGELIGEPEYLQTLAMDLEFKPEDFLRETSQIDFMNSKELRERLSRLQGISKKLIQRLAVDYHYKIAFPFVCLVVMLIGAPLAMRSTRGAAVGIGTSFLIVMMYYAMVSVCLALGKGGFLPPAFAAWFANLLFALVGLYLIKNTA